MSNGLIDRIEKLDELIMNLIEKGDWENNKSKENYIRKLNKEKNYLEKELSKSKSIIGQFLGQTTHAKEVSR